MSRRGVCVRKENEKGMEVCSGNLIERNMCIFFFLSFLSFLLITGYDHINTESDIEGSEEFFEKIIG